MQENVEAINPQNIIPSGGAAETSIHQDIRSGPAAETNSKTYAAEYLTEHDIYIPQVTVDTGIF